MGLRCQVEVVLYERPQLRLVGWDELHFQRLTSNYWIQRYSLLRLQSQLNKPALAGFVFHRSCKLPCCGAATTLRAAMRPRRAVQVDASWVSVCTSTAKLSSIAQWKRSIGIT